MYWLNVIKPLILHVKRIRREKRRMCFLFYFCIDVINTVCTFFRERIVSFEVFGLLFYRCMNIFLQNHFELTTLFLINVI